MYIQLNGMSFLGEILSNGMFNSITNNSIDGGRLIPATKLMGLQWNYHKIGSLNNTHKVQ